MKKNKQPNILVIVSTIRKNRSGKKVADWYLQQVSQVKHGLDFEILDLADLDLPLFAEPVSPLYHDYGPLQQKLAEKIGAADGFVFVTGEYNHSIPGSLKNFLDYLNAEWNKKAAAYVGYGSSGGVRSIEHIVQVMTELEVASTKHHLLIREIWAALDEQGQVKPEYVFGSVEKHVAELEWWVTALRAARK